MDVVSDNLVSIYCLKDPRTDIVRYIGKTKKTIKYRLSKHMSDKGSYKKCTWIKSLKKIGLKPIIEIIDEVTEQNWKEAERAYIRFFKSCGALLVNSKDGGDGGNLSSESIKKITDKQKKKEVYQYDLCGNFINEFISISDAARKTNSNVYHISCVCNGHRKNENKFMWKFKKNTIDKSNIAPYEINKPNSIVIYQYDKNGIFINEYKSLEFASRELKIKAETISSICKRKKSINKGYMFRFKKDVIGKSNITPFEEKIKKINKYPKREDGLHPLTGIKLSEEHRKNISLNHSRHMKGKKHSEATRLKIKNNRGIPNLSKEGLESMIKKLSKPVTQYDKMGNIISTFSSYKDASKKLKITHIDAVCRGIRKSAGGYNFKYI